MKYRTLYIGNSKAHKISGVNLKWKRPFVTPIHVCVYNMKVNVELVILLSYKSRTGEGTLVEGNIQGRT
jgi:hypothetical protein